MRARIQFSSSFQFFASLSPTARGLGKSKQCLSLTFEGGEPGLDLTSAAASPTSAATPSEYGELWAAHGAALQGWIAAADVRACVSSILTHLLLCSIGHDACRRFAGNRLF